MAVLADPLHIHPHGGDVAVTQTYSEKYFAGSKVLKNVEYPGGGAVRFYDKTLKTLTAEQHEANVQHFLRTFNRIVKDLYAKDPDNPVFKTCHEHLEGDDVLG